MLPLNPLMVPEWDGNHLWVQWDAVEDAQAPGFCLRYMVCRPPANQWSPWIEVGRPWPLKRTWFKFPLLKQGWKVKVQAARYPGDPKTIPTWEDAVLAKFTRPSATFRFESDLRKVTFSEGQIFMAMADNLPASFTLQETIVLEPGAQLESVMLGTQLSPFNHLDHPGDFLTQPEQGVRVTNTTVTANNLQLLGGTEAEIKPQAHPGGPVTVVLGKVNR